MGRPENILALDAAGAACSCAVWHEGRVTARCFETMSRGQSERLVPMANEVMAQAGLDYADLDALAVTLGPGGFTGVRIGLATARAFALALDLPVIGISNFEAVAAAATPEECAGRKLVVVLEAKRTDLYVQAFSLLAQSELEGSVPGCLEVLGEPAALLPEALDAALPDGPLLLIGDATEAACGALRDAGRSVEIAGDRGFADAALVAALAAARGVPDESTGIPAPLYLRAPDVTMPGGRPFGARPGAVGAKEPPRAK